MELYGVDMKRKNVEGKYVSRKMCKPEIIIIIIHSVKVEINSLISFNSYLLNVSFPPA